MPRLAIVPALIFAWTVSFSLWWLINRPINPPDVPGGRLECVSFTPYEGDENPTKRVFTVPTPRIEAALAALRTLSGCIRLYSSLGLYPDVVRIAAGLGIKVMLGIWIGADDKLNAREIEAALRLVEAYPGTVELLVVGNEVLLRREMSGTRLAGIIRSVKERTSVPVTYADVPHFWRNNPVVAEAVDVIGIHLLPYWDDPTPPTIDAAQEHLQRLSSEVASEFPGKSLLIAEVGWPSAGRTRGGATPSLVNEARFVREFADWATAKGLAYNLIEGWDQPWKREPEGTVGGYWGVLDRDLRLKFPLSGPVVEWPRWRLAVLFTGAVATVLLVWAGTGGRRPSIRGWAVLALIGPAAGASLVGLGHAFDTIPLGIPGDIGIAGVMLLTLTGTALLARHAAGGESPWTTARPASLADLLDWLRLPERPRPGPALLLGALQWAAVGSATILALALAFDGRHRDFLSVGYWIPSLALAVHAWRTGQPARKPGRRREEGWIGVALALGGVFSIDWWGNREALVWAIVCLALAAPWLPDAVFEGRRLARRLFFEPNQPEDGGNAG